MFMSDLPNQFSFSDPYIYDDRLELNFKFIIMLSPQLVALDIDRLIHTFFFRKLLISYNYYFQKKTEY